MTVVYTENLIVGQVAQSDLNNPLIGWDNVAPLGTFEATFEQSGFPASNLASPVTYQRWRGVQDGSVQYVTFTTTSEDPIDYVGLAGHNFGSGQFILWIEGTINGTDWDVLTPEAIPADDSPILFRFESGFYTQVRLAIQEGNTDPFLAVMYIGQILVLPRRIYVGHSPITLNDKTDVLTGRSETGQFLGRVVRREFNQSGIDMKNISPSFYRSTMKPWIDSAKTLPFFFAWRPYTYPQEVAYCWGTDDGAVINEKANGTVQITLPLQGLVA